MSKQRGHEMMSKWEHEVTLNKGFERMKGRTRKMKVKKRRSEKRERKTGNKEEHRVLSLFEVPGSFSSRFDS